MTLPITHRRHQKTIERYAAPKGCVTNHWTCLLRSILIGTAPHPIYSAHREFPRPFGRSRTSETSGKRDRSRRRSSPITDPKRSNRVIFMILVLTFRGARRIISVSRRSRAETEVPWEIRRGTRGGLRQEREASPGDMEDAGWIPADGRNTRVRVEYSARSASRVSPIQHLRVSRWKHKKGSIRGKPLKTITIVDLQLSMREARQSE